MSMVRADYEALLARLEADRDVLDRAIIALRSLSRQPPAVAMMPPRRTERRGATAVRTWACPYCREVMPLSAECEHTRGHVIDLVGNQQKKIAHAARLLGITYGRAHSYCRRAGIRKRARRA